jgi:bifunctional DNA-binding transcriptional regulator/antitoxin component of YhaV-PrlF toxin-antitoxin module
MPLVRIHYDGWLALPPVLRRQLGLKTGDVLEVVTTKEGVLLRRPSKAAEIVTTEPEAAPAMAEEPEPVAPQRRPRKKLPAAATLPPARSGRGRRSRTEGKGKTA